MFLDLKRSLGLLFVGLFLPSITGCSATRPLERRAVATAGEPKIVEEAIALSPSINASVTEINLDHPGAQTNIYFPIRLDFRQNGRTLRIEEVDSRIGPEWTGSSHVISAGNFDPGKWSVGNYEIDVYINAKKAATA